MFLNSFLFSKGTLYMNNTSHNALFGTKTADNLMHAFEHESKSALRGNIYSLQASMEKDTGTRRMLDEISENGTASGELWLSYLDETDTTPENLRRLSEIKNDVDSVLYDDMAQTADKEGFHEIAEKFRMASSVSKSHANLLDDRISQLEHTKQWHPDTTFRCPACGYVIMGNAMPDACPLCNGEF